MMTEYVFEYSWRHRHLQIVREIVNASPEKLSSMDMLHYSLSSYAVYKIVAEDRTPHIHTAITLVEKLFDELGDVENETLCRTYCKLLCGLKKKLVYDCLERSTPQQVVRVLAVHFPRRKSVVSSKITRQWPDVAKEVEEEKRDFRFQILFLSNKLCVRHKKQLNLPTIALLPPAQDFFTELEEAFPPTYLDKLMQEQDKDTQLGSQLLSPNITEEIIKDFVYGKFRLDPADLRALLQILETAETSWKHPSLGCLVHQNSLKEQHSEENAELSSTVVHQAFEESGGVKFADTEKVLDIGNLDEGELESSGTSDKTLLIPDIKKFWKSFDFPVCIVKVFYEEEITDPDTGLRHKIFR